MPYQHSRIEGCTYRQPLLTAMTLDTNAKVAQRSFQPICHTYNMASVAYLSILVAKSAIPKYLTVQRWLNTMFNVQLSMMSLHQYAKPIARRLLTKIIAVIIVTRLCDATITTSSTPPAAIRPPTSAVAAILRLSTLTWIKRCHLFVLTNSRVLCITTWPH